MNAHSWESTLEGGTIMSSLVPILTLMVHNIILGYLTLIIFPIDSAKGLQRNSDPEDHTCWILKRNISWVSFIHLHMVLTAQGGGEAPQGDHGLKTEGSGPSPATSKRLPCQSQRPSLE